MPVVAPLGSRPVLSDRVSSRPRPGFELDYPVGSAPATVA
ncbi:hypothetical protein C485_01925 [Natrinema altunense JCM 12890]|uniref:Uncharacterized protein n=1 Tax=Natrinema altunense (strain JCM 12890 / CGMCC 1.3731 / AJ2) TaxID=1227494 RepID=L9ZY96_NATA2|nr:hypothetical protein C485_01925 [Natrinema altunense JCM 12890]